MADQIKFEQQRFEKLKQVIEKDENETGNLYKPQLSKKSQQLAQKKLENAPLAHERLYNTVKDNTSKKGASITEDPKFVPQINKKSQRIQRSEKIQEILTEDAKRRLEKKQQQSIQSKKVEDTKGVQLTKNSINIVFKRFQDDFNAVSEHQGVEENAELNYQSTVEFCRNLGFLGTSPSVTPLMDELWKFVRSEVQQEGEQQQDDPQGGTASL